MRKEITIDGAFEEFVIVKRQTLSDVCVIYLQGSHMTTLKDLYFQLQAAFQFPSYFGENWNAVDECLCDLDWFHQKKFFIGIADFEKILSEYEYDLKYKSEELFNFEDSLKFAIEQRKEDFQVIIQEHGKTYELFPDEKN